MNIEAIDFLNRLNESGAIDYASYSHLHDLLTSEEPEWEYGARDTSGRVMRGSKDFAYRSVQGNALPDLIETVRRLKAGPWVPVES